MDLQDQMKFLFTGWIKDPTHQPQRASAGLQSAIVAFTRAREDALKWHWKSVETTMTMNLKGKVSWFGGPNDTGVAPDEGLAFIYDTSMAPHLFLPQQPPGTTGLARRLNPNTKFIALRFDYDRYPKDMLLGEMALVTATKTGKQLKLQPADWGPHVDTGRVADISQSALDALGIQTDDRSRGDLSIHGPHQAEAPAAFQSSAFRLGMVSMCAVRQASSMR